MKRVLLVQSFIEKGAVHRSFQAKKIDVFNDADDAFSVDHGVLAKMVFTVQNNSFDVINWLNKTKVTDYDTVIFDHWRFKLSQAMALAVFLTRKRIPFRTHEPEHIPALDKLGELARMSDQNISLPDSLVCQGTIAVNTLKTYGKILGWPLIAKAADGSQGNDNY
jgi:hypothetical protein